MRTLFIQDSFIEQSSSFYIYRLTIRTVNYSFLTVPQTNNNICVCICVYTYILQYIYCTDDITFISNYETYESIDWQIALQDILAPFHVSVQQL